VRSPDAARQPAIVKAIRIAKSFGASLELFHAISSPVFLSLAPLMDASIESLRAKSVEHVRKRLAKYTAVARKHGVKLEYSVAWDYPPHEAIVRRAAAIGADLIVAEGHKGTRTRAWLIHLTDWELLRTSPLPVLLLKNGRPYRHPVTLAAVDPGHTHAKPADLDAKVVAAAKQFSQALRGQLQVMHANNPPTLALVAGDPAINAASVTLTYEELSKADRDAFEKFLTSSGVPARRASVVEGHPALAIPFAARKLHAGLVVMGAVSRSGLKRVFIGNTAERVLNALPCDVLVVKPDSFESRVQGEPRGMRIVTPAPTPLVS
jgi:universal stress protein E